MNDRIVGWGGGAIFALAVIGVAAVIGATIAFFSMNLVAAGVCLVAAAISFNGIASCIFRK